MPAGGGRDCSRLGRPAESRECNTARCAAPLQLCAGSSRDPATFLPLQQCGGHGSCLRVPPNCTVDDPQCSARCRCAAGWRGAGCQLDGATFRRRQALRSTLLHTLVRSGQSTFSTDVTVQQSMEALEAVTAQPEELEGGALLPVLGAALS